MLRQGYTAASKGYTDFHTWASLVGKVVMKTKNPDHSHFILNTIFSFILFYSFNSSFKANTVDVLYIPFKTLANIFWSLHCMTPLPSNFVTLYLERTICTEEKAKVVASVWGGEDFIQFLAALAFLPKDDFYFKSSWSN